MENNIKTFAKDEVIFLEGAMESFMYDLKKGIVGIYVNYGKPEEKLLTKLNADEGNVIFGEMGMIDSMARSATAVALDEVEAHVVTGEKLGEYFKENPEAVLEIMQSMSNRIRALSKDYLDACHAVAEMIENEKSGKEKSNWFKKAVQKFIEDYMLIAEQVEVQSCEEYYRRHFGSSNMWLDLMNY